MPFKSKAQMAWGNSPAGKKALGGAAKLDEWNSASKGLKLPQQVKKPLSLLQAQRMRSKSYRKGK